MLINAQAFSALSSGITSMRKNVIALRKTIKTNQSKQAKSQVKTKLLERKEVEGEKRRKVEEDRESKKQTSPHYAGHPLRAHNHSHSLLLGGSFFILEMITTKVNL